MLSLLQELWPLVVSAAHVIGAAGVTVDAVLRKRQVPAVIGWVGLAWLAPVVGSLLYVGFGINRIQRAALALRRDDVRTDTGEYRAPDATGEFRARLATEHPTLTGLAALGFRTTGHPLLAGNTVEPLVDGDEAYPAMLAAIDAARETVALASYIFDDDAVGRRFHDALVAAVRRGVAVRVLIDDVGARYSRPTMIRRLAASGVPVAGFLPTRLPRAARYANLRNHRKLLVADGRVGFTGGTNIRSGHELRSKPFAPVQCVHFRLEGPVVFELQQTFVRDWAFATGELLDTPAWFPRLAPVGPVIARGVPDGPDSDLDNILELLLGALACATRHVRITSPYFLVDEPLLRALQVAALRGVRVDIVVPGRSNLPLLDWAMTPQWVPLLEAGCHVWHSPPPFDHSKLMTVDDVWSLIGSSNWDARSLLLNFEFNVECYDAPLARRLGAMIDTKIAASSAVSLAALRARSLPVRFRDGLTRLLSPYL